MSYKWKYYCQMTNNRINGPNAGTAETSTASRQITQMANGKDKRGGGTHTFATLSKLTVIKVASAISSVLSTTESTFSLTEVVQQFD